MDLRRLRYFLALAEELNVARAAKRCGLTPSVLSGHISDLEDCLGCSLFHGRGSDVSLSAAGQVFLPRARELVDTASTAEGEVRASAKAAGSALRFGHFGEWWSQRFAAGLRQVKDRCPDLRLQPFEYTPADLLGSLRRGEIDMALLENVDVGLRIDFKVKQLARLPACILMGKEGPLAKKRKVSLKDLREAVWVVWDERVFPGRRHLLLDAAEKEGFVPCVAWDADSENSVAEQVLACDAVSYVPDTFPKKDGLKTIPLKPAEIEFPVFLAWRKDAENIRELDAVAECLLQSPSS